MVGRRMGGPENVARQHKRGRGTVRERIAALADKESFREYGDTAGTTENEGGVFTPTNVVTGTVRVDGRTIVVGGDDFTIAGGASTQAALKKQRRADALAIRRRVPLVRLLGGGASVSGAYSQRGRSGYDLTSPSPLNLLAIEALARCRSRARRSALRRLPPRASSLRTSRL